MRYFEKIEEDKRSLYSLNFLLAEYEAINNLDRDLKVIATKISCDFYQTRDFSTRKYYKNLSSCIKKFKGHDKAK